VVGEAGDRDEPRGGGGGDFGDQVAKAPVGGRDAGGGEALAGPAIAEDDVAAAVGRAAEGGAVAEQVAQALGDDVDGGPLGGGDCYRTLASDKMAETLAEEVIRASTDFDGREPSDAGRLGRKATARGRRTGEVAQAAADLTREP
jgi:hypothetical protein